MSGWKDLPIIKRADGSFVITHKDLPYHVPNEGKWADMHAEVEAYATAYPQNVQEEGVKEPAPEERREAIKRTFTQRIQLRLDCFARTKTYDNMLSACTYVTSPDPVFSAEGRYCVEARDATWNVANVILQQALESGTIPDWEEVEAKLPGLEWPAARA